MAFKAVSREGRLYYVPGALVVPLEHAADAQSARVEGDISQITFARTWDEVPLPAVPTPPTPPEPPPVVEERPVVEELSVVTEGSASVEVPRSERRKHR